MKKVAVLAGGYSGESVVSLLSASNVMENIDREKYIPFLIVVDQNGWNHIDEKQNRLPVDLNDFSFLSEGKKIKTEGVFVMIHGDPGENGVIQGYFEMMNIPYTTGGVWSMSTTFNKSACNDYIRGHGFRTARNMRLSRNSIYSTSDITAELGLPLFVKPNQGGSSIAISKVEEKEALHSAIDLAFIEDNEIIIEEFLDGTELTCGVFMKGGEVIALPITEIVSENEFFDFAAKYEGKSDEITPARIKEIEKQKVHDVSRRLYEHLECRGMIRIDFMLVDGEPYVIEMNCVPGFSKESIIPQQANVMGMTKTELISCVIESCL